MFGFLDSARVLHSIANVILVSIPEETFLVMFTLILLKQFDFLESKKDGEDKFKKKDIFEISIPVLFVAIISNILRYFYVDVNITLFSSIFVLFVTIVIVYKQWTISGIMKTFFASVLSCFITILIQFSYDPIVFDITKHNSFENAVFLNFIITIPERIIEFSLVTYFILKKATFLKAKIFQPIISSKLLSRITIYIMLFNLLIFSAIGKLIWFDKILANYSLSIQVAVIIILILLPILNFTALIGTIYYIKNKEMYKSFLTKEIMLRLKEDLWSFTNNRDYDKIELTLKDMEANILDIYDENITKKDVRP